MLLLKIHRDREPEFVFVESQKDIFLAMQDGFVQSDALVSLIEREEQEAEEAWLSAHEIAEPTDDLKSLMDAKSMQEIAEALIMMAEFVDSVPEEAIGDDNLAERVGQDMHELAARIDRYVIENLSSTESDSEERIPF